LVVVRVKCPTCSKVLQGQPAELPFKPFCSERCRSIDLGNWLDASYRIGVPVEEDELDQGLPTEGESTPKRPPN
jgi:endogenous inhibitor of DNA gyrase (YacG/DUF329 family)